MILVIKIQKVFIRPVMNQTYMQKCIYIYIERVHNLTTSLLKVLQT